MTDPHVAQLAHAHAGATQNLDHDPPTDIAATDVDAKPSRMKRDRRFRDSELLRDLVRSQTPREDPADHQRGRAWRGPGLRFVALGCGCGIQ